MSLHPGIFKAYDIRGRYPDQIDETLAQALGRAYGLLARRAGQCQVAVGRDGRLSAPALHEALVSGLLASGLEVLDLGAVPTPVVWFAASTLCPNAIQVTASHNPAEDNGFKLVLGGETLHGEELQALRRVVEALGEPGGAVRLDLGGAVLPELVEGWESVRPEPVEGPAQGASTSSARTEKAHARTGPAVRRHLDLSTAYVERIAGDIRLARPMKVVLDAGNGIAGACALQVLRAIGCEVVPLYCEVDGRFPHHHPDPGQPRNLRDLIAAVQSSGAELGLALDGDGDRLGVVTASGHIVAPDRQLMLFARDVLSRVPGAPIVFDVKSTQRLAPAITAAGGQPVMHKSGYVLIKSRMRELGAPLAGELSGHIFFGERWYGFDDGTYAACRLLEIASCAPDAGALLEALPANCATPELMLPCEPGEPHRLAAQLAREASFPGAEVSTLDGLRVDWPDGFGLVRASNTNPCLILRFEGHTPEALARIREEMMARVRQIKPQALLAE